jgi:DNA-binding MarR family transcriptional regulator
MDDEPWLSHEQQCVWRDWVAVNAQLFATLSRQLQDHGLSLPDFAVLVQLTDAPDERVRVIALAEGLAWERSRLSHHVKRMESRGLVERRECPQDGRGAFVLITDAGRAAIERAAPEHARTVRDVMFSHLSEDELQALASVTSKALVRLHCESTVAV